MKKILTIFAAAVAALTLASCNKDEMEINNDVISIDQVTENINTVTKATAATTTTTSLESFKLYIYNGGASAVNADKFTYTGDNTKGWSNGQTYHWLDGKTYQFLAMANNNKAWDATGWTLSADKDNFLQCSSYKVNNAEAVSTTQDDPVFAFATGTQSTPVTKLKFYHVLSRVRVKATYDATSTVAGASTDLTAKVLGWKFIGVGVEGALNGAQPVDDDIDWTIKETGTVYDWARYTKDNAPEMADYGMVGEGDAKKYVAWCNVIPGAPASELVVAVAFYDKAGTYIATRNLHAKVKDGVATLTNSVEKYQSGYAYIYNITIKNDGGADTDPDGDDDDPLDKFKIKVNEVEVADWVETTGGTATYGK